MIEYHPLLELQRGIQAMPRGMDRFQEYLRLILRPDGQDVDLPPLLNMNPMAKDHVTRLIDEALAIGADDIAAGVAAKLSSELSYDPASFRVSLVVIDDLMGGWTNRWACEYRYRYELAQVLKLRWIAVPLWSSEPVTTKGVRVATATAIERMIIAHRRGPPRTLGDVMDIEGESLVRAGAVPPPLDEVDLSYSREVIESERSTDEMGAMIACLFGDEAARSLGMRARGLSPMAGLAVAVAEARERGVTARDAFSTD